MSTSSGSTRKWASLVSASVFAAGALMILGFLTPSVATSRSGHSAAVVTANLDRADHESNTKTLHFDVRFSPFDLIDVDHSGAQDFSNGDEIVFHDQLFSHQRRVGDQGGSCVIIDGSVGLANCTGVVRLRDGQISYQFLNSPPPDKTLVVTGGTGRYLNVGGKALLHEDATGPTGTLTLYLTFPES
jgi:hypothetical protein